MARQPRSTPSPASPASPCTLSPAALFPQLVDRLVQIALERHRDRHRLDQGIKEFLAEL
jgi:hypothetical protein